MAPEIVTLEQAANILKISKHTAYKKWHKWREYGVRVLKMETNATPRFYVSDLLKMMEAPK
jgi:transposase